MNQERSVVLVLCEVIVEFLRIFKILRSFPLRIGADLVKNKEALNRLARSGDAQRLMELLRQGGGIQGAAEAAVKGDTSQLVGMMQRLMNTPEGGELVERISRQARQSGLTD